MSQFFSRAITRIIESQLLFPLLAVVISILLWTGTVLLIDVERRSAHLSALSLTRELNETYEAQVLRVLGEIEKDFKLIQYTYEQHAADSVLPELSRRELLPPTLLFNIALIAPNGEPAAGSMPLRIALNSDRINAHRLDNNLIIESKSHGPSGEPVLQFRRRLQDRQGQFAGVAAIEVDAAFFVSSYDQSRLGDKGTLGLLGQDGKFKVRRVGNSVSNGPLVDYREFMSGMSNVETTARLRRSSIDGVERFIAARELFGFPLAVVVGISRSEYLAPLQQRARSYVWRCVGINILLLLVITILWHLSRKLAESRRQEMQAKIAHAEQVEYLAFHDGLTGLPNRSLFSQLLEQDIAEAARNNQQLAVMFLDLDHFKHINDTLGHDAGDELLKEVSQRLKDCLRESDVVARLGGDEFVIILHDVPNSAHSATVALKIISAVARAFTLEGQQCRVTASIGISTFPEDGRDEETLTNNADIAMYKAKQEGKNNFQLYSQHLHAESLERLSLENNLRQALDKNQFCMYYLAKRSVASGVIIGVEAQLRWQHPDLNVVPPSQFLGTAEDMGLLVPIGRWMLNRVCQQHVDWLHNGAREVCVAVELWAPIFFADHVTRDIEDALSATGLPPHLLELEIGENVLMQDINKSLKILQQLKTLGVRVAVGNFGVGYSCLSRLGELPVDEINIDRSIIHAIEEDEAGHEMAHAVCNVGRALGLSLVVNGVETASQMAFIRANTQWGLNSFYDGQALPVEEFSAQLHALRRHPDDSQHS